MSRTPSGSAATHRATSSGGRTRGEDRESACRCSPPTPTIGTSLNGGGSHVDANGLPRLPPRSWLSPPPRVAADVAVDDPLVVVGESTKLVLSDPARDFGPDAQVSFGPVVHLDDLTLIDGDLHCIVTGLAPGAGVIRVEDGGTVNRIDPGVVCFHTAEDLARIVDALLVQLMNGLDPPASAALHTARVLFTEAQKNAGGPTLTPAARLARAASAKVVRAGTLSGSDLGLLVILIRAWIKTIGPQGGFEALCGFKLVDRIHEQPPPARTMAADSTEFETDRLDESLANIKDSEHTTPVTSDLTDPPRTTEFEVGGQKIKCDRPPVRGIAAATRGPAIWGASAASSSH